MDAMSVPRPPRFVPTMSAAKFDVKPESRMAAGTFDSTWLAMTATASSWPSMSCASAVLTISMRPTLPTKTKNAMNVNSSA